MVADYALTVGVITSALVWMLQYVKQKDWMRTAFGAVPLVALLGYCLRGNDTFFPMALCNLYLFTVSVYRLRLGIRKNDLGLINTAMFMMAALIVARFFDREIEFVLKGIVFILIGIGFLVTNFVMLRRKGGAA